MNEPMGLPPQLRRRGPLEAVLNGVCRLLAYAGGALFLGLMGMSLVSIVGRKLGFGSVNGDIELMQAGTAVAAAAFLPYCALMGENLKVDFFTEHLPAARKRWMDGSADLILAVAVAVLAWRTALSAISVHEAGEVTTLVSLPVWIPVAALVPSLALTSLCAFYRAATAFSRRRQAVPVASGLAQAAPPEVAK